MYVLTAVLWTILLIGQIIDASNGGQPIWFDVFIPLTTLAICEWIDAAKHHR